MTTDEILNKAREAVLAGRIIPKDKWLEIAFNLNTLYLDEVSKLENLRQSVSIAKLSIMKSQAKRNVAAVNLETETLEEYKAMKIQEAKVEQVKEYIRIAKRNSDNL